MAALNPDSALEEIGIITKMMKAYQDSIETLGKQRKTVVLSLREEHVTYKRIAEAMGTSEQLVFKIVKDEIPRDPITGLARRGRPPKIKVDAK
jgi:DNA-directed RNA polymerase specialized sigma24 family protein